MSEPENSFRGSWPALQKHYNDHPETMHMWEVWRWHYDTMDAEVIFVETKADAEALHRVLWEFGCKDWRYNHPHILNTPQQSGQEDEHC